MAATTFIQLPFWQLPIGLAASLALLFSLVWVLGRIVHPRMASGEPPDWSVPPLETSLQTSPLHRWDVRCKIATIVGYCFFVSALTHLPPALIALAISCIILVIARSSLIRVLARLLAIIGFLAMFAVVMPLTVPIRDGDTVLVFSTVPRIFFNLRGLHVAGLIAAKATAIAMLMEPLFATAPLPLTLHGLSRLGVPDMAGQMVLLSHRYLHVFRHEARRMASGMRVRGFRPRSDPATLRAIANFLGMLFIRSFERTERVFAAMQARGYRGRFPDPATLQLRIKDLILAGIWLLAAAALTAYDRLY